MITIHKSHERGHSQLGWLNSYHTFSFGNYYDPKFMGFGHLRVINEDTVKPGYGFGKHPHHNMEIISYVISGTLEHKDSMGNGSLIKAGEIQKMSAGTGVEHSEYNPSATENLHFLQIWIIPEQQQLTPSYEQKMITQERNKLILIGSQTGTATAIKIQQDINLFAGYLTTNYSLKHTFINHRVGWLQLIKGKITLNNQLLSSGDGAAITNEDTITIACSEDAEFLLFDLTSSS
ncbi:pirin-like protein [Legionella busanensis]|uniref:Pirin-like protein n=1 Tax=Legionella busanensis TaxID=190655 RepID=A0A378JQ79_9GAMM|nr:pirin family protein [Legionella busanensis]STX52423.1 pirin-like protein [Legionella busanensis]